VIPPVIMVGLFLGFAPQDWERRATATLALAFAHVIGTRGRRNTSGLIIEVDALVPPVVEADVAAAGGAQPIGWSP